MLYREVLGQGPDVVVLHGWGMNCEVMRDFAEDLAADFRVTLMDLPGHGRSGAAGDPGLQGTVEAVLAHAPPVAHWLGWSLGATLCLRAATCAEARVHRMIFLAGTPRFVQRPDWPGMDEILFRQFAQELRQNPSLCWQRFLGLQTGRAPAERGLAKALRSRLSACAVPRAEALEAGLEILWTADLRSELAATRSPVLAILGREDRLVPATVGEAMTGLSRQVEVEIVERANHLPFWTHREDTAHAVRRFLSRHHA